MVRQDPEKLGRIIPKAGGVYRFNSRKKALAGPSTAKADCNVGKEKVTNGILRDVGRVIWKTKPVSERICDLVAEIQRLDTGARADNIQISSDEDEGAGTSISSSQPVQSGLDD